MAAKTPIDPTLDTRPQSLYTSSQQSLPVAVSSGRLRTCGARRDKGQMGKINTLRVITGGLLAGLIINVCETLVSGFWLAKDWAAALKAIGVTTANTTAQAAVYNAWGFIMGILAIWLYAAIRPRFGPGACTAVIAALTLWLPAYLLSMVPPAMMGIFPMRLMAITVALGLVELLIATLAGASLYKEPAQPAALPPAN